MSPLLSRPIRKRWRWLGWMALALALLLVLIAGAALLSLRSEAVRQALLARAATTVERMAGLRLEADDFHLGLAKGALRVEGLRLSAAPEAPAFLTVATVDLEVRLGALLRRSLVVRRVMVVAPRLNLGAPLPSTKAEEPDSAPAMPAVEITELQLRQGVVDFGPVPYPDSWLESGQVHEIEVVGSLVAGQLELSVENATVVVEPSERPAQALRLSGHLAAAPDGSVALDDLELQGEALELSVNCSGRDPAQSLECGFRLLARPGELLPELGEAARLTASGELDVRRMSGWTRVHAEKLPAELLEPWLGSRELQRLGATGSWLDLDLDLESPSESPNTIVGSVDLSWKGPERTLLSATADATARRSAAGALPDPGSVAGQLQLQARGLPAAVLELGIGHGALERLGLSGSKLDLEAELGVDAAQPERVRARAAAAWTLPGRRLLDLAANGSVTRDPESVTFDWDSLAGEARLAARDLPIELSAPWLGEDLLQQAGLAGARLQAEATINASGRRNEAPTGEVKLLVESGDETILDLAAQLTGPSPAPPQLRLNLVADLLPEAAGRRRLTGELVATTWSDLGSARIDAGRLELAVPDVAQALQELERLWPQIAGATDERLPLSGALTAEALASGPLSNPEVRAEVLWNLNESSRARLQLTGRPLEPSGEAELLLEIAELQRLLPEAEGRVALVADLRGSPERYSGQASLEGSGLRFGADQPSLQELRLDLETDGSELRLSRLSGRVNDGTVSGNGLLALERPLRRGNVELELEKLLPGVDRIGLRLQLAEGSLQLEAPDFDLPGGRGRVRLSLPLAALSGLPGLEAMHDWPLEQAVGPVVAELELPDFDAAALLAWLKVENSPARLRASVSANLLVDPRDLPAATGKLQLEDLAAESEGRILEAESLQLKLADHRLVLHPLQLTIDGNPLRLAGEADLAAEWSPPADAIALLKSLSLEASGSLDASLLNPYLAGGSATGNLELHARVAGTPESLHGEVDLNGPDAVLVYTSPYFTRLVGPQVALALSGGELSIRDARARLNEGDLRLSGSGNADDGWTLSASLQGVRYRLDYGLSTWLSGDLKLALPAAGRGELSGALNLERGTLRRDVDLDRELVGLFFAQPEVALTEKNPLENIDLRVSLTTTDGIRVKNNTADLRLLWTALEARGSVASPVLVGRVEVEPGGLMFAYGQTVRLDTATVIFTGEPDMPPEMDLMVTTSLEDPSIAQEAELKGESTWRRPAADDSLTGRDALASGLAGYYGGRLVSQLTAPLPGTEISIRPILVFGEADPGARMTVSQALSTNVAFAISTDLRKPEARTYILDLHEFPFAPRMVAQLFRNDDANPGTTIQQTFDFGGRAPATHDRPRIRKIRVEAPVGISTRKLKGSIDVREGDLLPDGADFDIEIEVAEYLRARGYPEAVVSVEMERAAQHRVDLRIDVAPGPRTRFKVEGESLSTARLRTIASLYRSDFYEPAALEEMRRLTVSVLRARGYLDPQVELTAAPEDPGDPSSPRTVTIRIEPGRQVQLGPPMFVGLDEGIARELAARFPGRVERIELALAEPEADGYLLRSLAHLGFPEAEVIQRQLSTDGSELTVELNPGRQRRLAEIRILGLEGGAAEDWLGKLPLAAGDPARSDRIAAGALQVERELRSQGYAEAEVRSRIETVTAEQSAQVVLTYEVRKGPLYRIEEVRLEGLQATRSSWAERVARLEPGSQYQEREIAAARGRLSRTGVFSTVRASSERDTDGGALVRFGVEEKPRFLVGYGLRWEDNKGGSVVVDLMDRNFLGRGVTLGLRALYAADDRSTRLYAQLPNLLGSRSRLELFLDDIREIEFGLISDRLEGTLQLSTPLSPHATGRVYGRVFSDHIREQEPLDPLFPFDQRISSPELGWQYLYDTRRDPVSPEKALFASIDISGSEEFLGSDFNYLRSFSQVNVYRPVGRLGSRRLFWAQSYRLGLADSLDEQELVRSVRFFAGGDFSVRGYPTDSLGPQEDLGVVVRPLGGEAVLVLNQELRFEIWQMLSGVLFFDAGNVWGTLQEIDSQLFTSTGFGLRASTPVGLVRLDVARPLDRREDDPSFKLYFGFGNTF